VWTVVDNRTAPRPSSNPKVVEWAVRCMSPLGPVAVIRSSEFLQRKLKSTKERQTKVGLRIEQYQQG
jgi:hypothetical protein